ncbi:MAG: exodeoxyribonuclease VII small subunit [Roseburia sp.]|nr:exodeoxyribonuclease VII small subunit [Roseburia sp.]
MGRAKEQEDKEVSLEQNFARIEELLEQLSAEDIPLEQAFTIYSEGMNVLKRCNEQIDRVEKKVMKLNEEGELEEL